MKPSKRKVIEILTKKLINDINEKEEKLNIYRIELLKLINGELKIDVHDYKGTRWYMDAKSSYGSKLPFTLVYEFVKK